MSRIFTKRVEADNKLVCAYGHNQKIINVALDINLPKDKRLYCVECLEMADVNSNLLPFRKVGTII